jgi:eukaryotic-like serine/threonine-protein kinase
LLQRPAARGPSRRAAHILLRTCTETPLEPGSIIAGRYRVDRVVAAGGFGVVHAGRHLVLDAPIAIKVLRSDRFQGEQRACQVAALLDEARVLARLRHPNIVSVLDAGVVVESAMPWVVLEWCEGRTLKDTLSSGDFARPLRPTVAWRLLRPIVAAIAYAHQRGVVHRDLKPSNVIVTWEGDALVPRVIDFGVAKATAPGGEPPSGETHTRNPIAFTPAYAAPEQIACARTGPWTDVHALGLLFVQLLTALPPYGGDHESEAAIDPARPTPRSRGLAVGEALEAVLARALALRSGERHPHAASLLEDIDRALADDPCDDAVFVRPAPAGEAPDDASKTSPPSWLREPETEATESDAPRSRSIRRICAPLLARHLRRRRADAAPASRVGGRQARR